MVSRRRHAVATPATAAPSPAGRLGEKVAVGMVLDPFLRVLHYLHTRCIVHRDIKPGAAHACARAHVDARAAPAATQSGLRPGSVGPGQVAAPTLPGGATRRTPHSCCTPCAL